MANKNPIQTKEFKKQQMPKYGDVALGNPIATRYPADADEALRAMPDRQEFIRKAVLDALAKRDVVSSDEMPGAGIEPA